MQVLQQSSLRLRITHRRNHQQPHDAEKRSEKRLRNIPRRKAEYPERHEHPGGRAGEPLKGVTGGADVEPRKPVCRAHREYRSHQDAQVHGLAGNIKRCRREVGLIAQVAGCDPEGHAVGERIELFPERAVDVQAAGDLTVKPVQERCKQDQHGSHAQPLGRSPACKYDGYESAGQIAKGEYVRYPDRPHKVILNIHLIAPPRLS